MNDWLRSGVEVVALIGRDNRPSEVLTIDRVLKRDVVLSNDDRWSLTRLAPNGEHITRPGRDVWSGPDALFPATHPRVVEAMAAEEKRRVAYRVRTATMKANDAARKGDWPAALDAARLIVTLLGDYADGES